MDVTSGREGVDDSYHNIKKLFDNALECGFTTLDSYQLLKLSEDILFSSVEKMFNSGSYNEKQKNYITTMLAIKTPLENIIQRDIIEHYYNAEDKKRITDLHISSLNPFNFKISAISENGISHLDSSNIDAVDDLSEQISEHIQSHLNDGDHIIRFHNEIFRKKYDEEMWVPVLLRGGELSPPRL